MALSKGKMSQWINYKMRVTVDDGRMLVGTFMAFDAHMNIVLGDCVEMRRVRKGPEAREVMEKRPFGLVLLRGESVVSMSVDGPPPVQKNKFRNPPNVPGGPGVSVPAGRGLAPVSMSAAPQPGLMNPVHGVGMPMQQRMLPPHMMGRGRGMPPMPPHMQGGRGGRY